jgi:hypothetical protein
MDVLYPRMSRARLTTALRASAVGAVAAAGYGALHDQVSWTISPEYFTRLKFQQFAWADVGAPPRVFVAEVGVLATWWMGLIAGWTLVRFGRLSDSWPEARPAVLRAFAIVLGIAAAGGVVGALLGRAASRGDLSGWNAWRDNLQLRDVPGFVVVAYLHWASYLAGAAGIAAAVVDARRR